MKISRIYMLGLTILLILILSACSGGNNNTSTNSKPTTDLVDNNDLTKPILDQIGPIPLTGTPHEFLLRLNNPSQADYKLNNVEVIDPIDSRELDSKVAKIKTGLCPILKAHSYCTIGVTPLLTKSGAFVIKVNLKSESETLSVKQIIRVSNQIKPHAGVYFVNDIDQVSVRKDGNFSFSLPIVLDHNFSKLVVRNGILNCSSYTKGSACTYLVQGNASVDRTLIATELSSIAVDKPLTKISYTSLVRKTSYSLAHLQISQPEYFVNDNNADTTSSKFVIYNSGNGTATKLKYVFSEGFDSDKSVTTCRNILVAGASCIIGIKKINQLRNNQTGTISISYISGKNETIRTKIVVIGHIEDNILDEASLNIDSSDPSDFIYTLVNTNKKVIYTVTNNGKKALFDIRYSLDGLGLSMSEDQCSNRSLSPGESCFLTISYSPKQEISSSKVLLKISANYLNSLGNTTAYERYRPIVYSAIDKVNALSMSPGSVRLYAQIEKGYKFQVFTVKNLSVHNAVLGKPALESLNDPNELVIVNDNSLENSCADDSVLLPGEECQLRVKYAPKNKYDQIVRKLIVPLKQLSTLSGLDEQVTADLILNSGDDFDMLPNIQVSVSYSYPGTLELPFLPETPLGFILLGGRELEVKYKFTNDNNMQAAGVAIGFNVSTASLPVAVGIKSSTCPLGVNLRNLAAGSSCEIVLQIPKPSFLQSGLLGSGVLLPLDLEYSYDNVITTNRDVFSVDTRQVNITKNWVTGLKLEPSVQKQANGSYFVDLSVFYDRVIEDDAFLQNNRIDISANIEGLDGVGNKCADIPSGNKFTCKKILELPASMPSGLHYLEIKISYPNLAGSEFSQLVSFEI